MTISVTSGGLYDKKGKPYDEYSTAKLKRMLKSKSPYERKIAKTVLGWEKRGKELDKQFEKEKKGEIYGLNEKSILRGVQD